MAFCKPVFAVLFAASLFSADAAFASDKFNKFSAQTSGSTSGSVEISTYRVRVQPTSAPAAHRHQTAPAPYAERTITRVDIAAPVQYAPASVVQTTTMPVPSPTAPAPARRFNWMDQAQPTPGAKMPVLYQRTAATTR